LPLSSERGDPKVVAGSLSTSSTDYDTVASLTVGASPRRAEVIEITLQSDDYAKTNWQVTIGGTQQFTGVSFHAAITLPFRKGYLAGAEVVLVEAASTDGTAVVAKATITAREYTPYEYQIWVFKKGLASEERMTSSGMV
jgi:predicted secreted protein